MILLINIIFFKKRMTVIVYILYIDTEYWLLLFYHFSKSFKLATNVPTFFVFFNLGVVFKSKYIQISSFAIFHKIFRDFENFKVFQRRLGLSRGARFSTLCPEGYMVRLTQRSTTSRVPRVSAVLMRNTHLILIQKTL